ncbi:MAG TPA: polyprenyl synthetase family protein [Actinomycetales bacterium]|nr:polyprenyl synthetase family protein [Actinomycetales bacterium]
MTAVLPALTDTRELVLPALRAAVNRLDDRTRLVAAYHLGWCDEHGVPIEANGGKAVRPALALLAAEAAGGPRESAVPGAVAVELVHNFSLVHDDLMDRDLERRHRATVWALWGDATAVLAGDAMLSLAHEVLADSRSPFLAEASAVLATATRELIRGQVQDLAFERRDDVGLTECVDMASAKTGALLGASAAIGAVLAGADTTTVRGLATYGEQVGLAFQLVDDLLGIWGRPEVTGKPVASDLRSRKKTLPITWAIQNGGDDGTDLALWLRRDAALEPDDHELRKVAGLVERAGGRTWARDEAWRRVTRAAEALAPLRLRDDCRRRLLDLATFVVERDA